MPSQDNKKKISSIRMTAEAWELLEKLAALNKRSQANQIEVLIEEAYKEMKAAEKKSKK